MPDPTAQPLAEIEAVAVAMHDALYPGRHDQEWATLDEDERDEYRRMAEAGFAATAALLTTAALASAPVVAKARSVIETKVWAATLAGLVMAAAPIAYDVAVAYAAGWPEAPPWIAPLLVALGTLGAGYGAKHTPRPDLVAQQGVVALRGECGKVFAGGFSEQHLVCAELAGHPSPLHRSAAGETWRSQ